MLALYIIAGLVLLVVLVLSVPVDLAFDLAAHEGARRRVRVAWLFGLVGKDMVPRKEKRPSRARKERKPGRRRRPDVGLILSILRSKGLLGAAGRLLRRLVRGVHVRVLDGSVRAGLDDPADTGLMYAALWPASSLIRSAHTVRFSLEPAFGGPTFEVSGCGAIRVFPAEMIGSAVAFVLSPPGLRVIRLMVVWWWKQRR